MITLYYRALGAMNVCIQNVQHWTANYLVSNKLHSSFIINQVFFSSYIYYLNGHECGIIV